MMIHNYTRIISPLPHHHLSPAAGPTQDNKQYTHKNICLDDLEVPSIFLSDYSSNS